MHFVSAAVALCFVFTRMKQLDATPCSPECPPSTVCVRRTTICTFSVCPTLQQCVRTINRRDLENNILDGLVSVPISPSPPSVEPVCPGVPQNGPCVEQCRHDSDCRKAESCCFNGCGHTCRTIGRSLRQKAGSCPWYVRQMDIGCERQCRGDQDCPGMEKCCETSCGSNCSQPCFHWLRSSSGTWRVPRRCRSW